MILSKGLIIMDNPIGTSWKTYKETRMTGEERDALTLKTDIICEILESRQQKGLTQKQLEEASGVKQPIIARLENGMTDPQLTTVLKILRPLGKTLKIVPISEGTHNRV